MQGEDEAGRQDDGAKQRVRQALRWAAVIAAGKAPVQIRVVERAQPSAGGKGRRIGNRNQNEPAGELVRIDRTP